MALAFTTKTLAIVQNNQFNILLALKKNKKNKKIKKQLRICTHCGHCATQIKE